MAVLGKCCMNSIPCPLSGASHGWWEGGFAWDGQLQIKRPWSRAEEQSPGFPYVPISSLESKGSVAMGRHMTIRI